jgi:hypothetical protein
LKHKLTKPVKVMITNGLYCLMALAIDGAGVDAGGVLILHDGKIHGGDSYVYYEGTYECSNGRWQGAMTSREHTPTTRPMEERVQHISFSGDYTDAAAEVNATAIVGKHHIRYDATLRLLVAT